MINNLRGIVDSALLVSQLSFVRDGEETVKLAKEESKPEFDDNYASGFPNLAKNDSEEA